MVAINLEKLINEVNVRISETSSPFIKDEQLHLLYQNLDLAYPLLDKILNDDSFNGQQITLTQQSCLFILNEIFSYIVYKIELKHPWAKQFCNDFQHQFAQKVFTPKTHTLILQYLLEALYESQWPIIPEIQTAHCNLIEKLPIDKEHNDIETVSALIENIAKLSNGDEFNLYNDLLAQTYQLLPAEVQSVLAIELAYSQFPKVIETSILMLLHPEKIVRQQIAMALLDNINQISPISFRRFILIRNWVPKEEQQEIDTLIKTSRSLHIECASLSKNQLIDIQATSFDNLGTQTILITNKIKNKYSITSIQLKENYGIQSPTVSTVNNLKELNALTKSLYKKDYFISIKKDYLNYVIPHFLGLHLLNDAPPSPWLLKCIETIGFEQWHPHQYSTSDLLNTLIKEHTRVLTSSKYFNNALALSANWPETHPFAKYWIEQDATTQETLSPLFLEHNQSNVPIKLIITKVIELIFEPKREIWINRFVWLSLWAKNISPRPKNFSWHTFLYLAKVCDTEQPLSTIPLMQTLAAQTLLLCSQDILDGQEQKIPN